MYPTWIFDIFNNAFLLTFSQTPILIYIYGISNCGPHHFDFQYLYMGIITCIWASLPVYGHHYLYMGISTCIWASVFSTCIWASVPVYGHKYLYMGISTCIWASVPVYGHQYLSDTRIIRGHRLPISRYRDKLSATYRGQIAVLKIVDFFTTSTFLSPSKSRKSQATKCRAFKTNSVLNKHRISKNQWTANSL